MKIVIFLFDGITALDAVGPFESLSRLPDTKVVFVGKDIGPVRTGNGFLALHADATIQTERTADVLIIPGGNGKGLGAVIADAEVHSWIREIDALSQWTCSICTGAFILGAAGVLSGKTAATHWRGREVLSQFGPTYTDARVAIDGKYMTSAGVSAGMDMGLTLCAELAGREIAEAVQLSMQYDPKPPFDAGNPEFAATPERVKIIETILQAS